MSKFYKFAQFASFVYFRLFHRFEIKGLQNVPTKGAFILASNHLSFIDPPALGCRLPRNLHYFARSTLFSGPLGFLISNLNSIPVNRDHLDLKTLKTVLRVLGEGHPLLVFPEGTRSVNGLLSEGQRGVGLLVAKSSVPVLPARIEGAFEILGKGKLLPRIGRKLQVSYGPRLDFKDLDPGKTADNRYELISSRIMSAISEIK